MQIDGHTRMAAVVARPIRHSISPFIHNYAFDASGINGVYVAWDIPEEDLQESVQNVRRYDMFGINLSMPYKQVVIPFLDELNQAAQLIGAVNTVVNRQGQLIGYNTDGYGFFKALEKDDGFTVKDKIMTILGGGGAATSLIVQAALNGAKKINIFNQTQFLEETKAKAEKYAAATGVELEVFPVEDQALIQEKILESDLLVNATSVGMDGQSMVIANNTVLPAGLRVADVIYQPFETPFLSYARSKGLKASNGLGMLLYQAAKAFELWTDQSMPTDQIWQELEKRYDV
ncbi:shikimate dehydrogenase [Streptococcus sobrinus]|uniref:Shikimate dehydrogenase (NADP(+)) n=2 Tax=Streptococcus sobrinus TaxID=1310 RepID=A0ABM6W5A9_9STRE|nr:shikimate dehydrogenase [Streptococcus sobrinus]AWN20955.1 shikimate dehydrogenase [Streptococcus sobrinus]EMP72984.1 shikimate 5-dehydrogenase [Streptococcus sobrinus DSM 20742 = ATCC 33478]OZV23434.1 shikimate dehydrogenase [Streptococcus sobrinus]SQG13737.1 shikimate 5-dehydrogenase [Streptococcus sobrinus]